MAMSEQARLTLQIPLIGGKKYVTVSAEWPVSEEDWQFLLDVLNAMKPGLVERPPSSKEDDNG
jgi:hypothetical protein